MRLTPKEVRDFDRYVPTSNPPLLGSPEAEAALALFYEAGFQEYNDPKARCFGPPLHLPGRGVQVLLNPKTGSFLVVAFAPNPDLQFAWFPFEETEDFLLRLLDLLQSSPK